MNSAEVLIKFKGDTRDADNSIKEMSTSMGKLTKSITLGNLAAKGISKGFSLIASNLDGAISRFDTLKNFPKVMSNLGISTKDADKAIKTMSDKLSGLPTTLDQGALAVQRFTSKNGDVKKSTDIFLALNNAILAGGASTQIQASALEQMTQSYSKGKMDMMEWRTIQMAMPAQLNQVAKAMGVSTDELGEMMRQGDHTKETMDKFMATIIQLNKEGMNGFASFEKQARNSTAGIGTAIVVAKTQIVKGITDIIDGLNTGLKKAKLGSISDIIANIGKSAKKGLDKIAKMLSKIDFKKVLNFLKAMIPLLKTIIVLWATWKVGSKLNEFTNRIKLAKNSLKMFATTMKTATTSQSGLNSLIGKSQILMKSFSKSTASTASSASVLSGALGSTSSIMAVLPWAGAIAGAGLLAFGIYKLATSTDDYIKKAHEQVEASKQVMKSQEEANKEAQKKIDSSGSEMQYYKNLQTELKSIVDENGKIKQGYEDRAKVITSILAGALGVEADIVDGVIQNYKEYNKQIDKTIAKKKAKIILDTQEKQYTDAIKNQITEQKKLISAKKEMEKLDSKLTYLRQQQSKVKFDTDPSSEWQSYQRRISNAQRHYDAQKELYDASLKTTQEYTYDIMIYEKNMELFQQGHYSQMITDTDTYIANLSNDNQKKADVLQQNIISEQGQLEALRQMKKKAHTNAYDDQIKAHEQTLKQYQKELGDLNTKIATDRNTWIQGTQKTLSDLSTQKIKFKDLGNGYVQAYVNGTKAGEPVAYSKMQDFGQKLNKELGKAGDKSPETAKKIVSKYANKFSDNESKTKAKNSVIKLSSSMTSGLDSQQPKFVTRGKNASQGVVKGATSPKSLSDLRNAGIKMANTLEGGYCSATKTHSPSRLFMDLAKYVPEGIAIGINSNLGVLSNAMKNVASTMVGSMANANISPQLATSSSLHYSPNVIVNNHMNMTTDPLGQVVGNIKTFANGSRNDYNYGIGG